MMVFVGIQLLSLAAVGAAASSLTLSFSSEVGNYGYMKPYRDFPMEPSNSSFCFLTNVAGDFGGDSEMCAVITANGMWYLRVGCGTSQCGCFGRCMKLPDSRTYGTVHNFQVLSGTGEQNYTTTLTTSNSICALTQISGNFVGSGENCQIQNANGYWALRKRSNQAVMSCGMMCLYRPTVNWDPPSGFGSVGNLMTLTGSFGEMDLNSHYTKHQASLGLWQVGGSFAGEGERCSISIDNTNGYWAVTSKSGQTSYVGGIQVATIPDNGWNSATARYSLIDSIDGVSLFSITYGIYSSDTLYLSEEWGASAELEMSEDLVFEEKSLTIEAYKSVSEGIQVSIAAGVGIKKTLGCPEIEGYPYVKLYQWDVDLVHNGSPDVSTIKTNMYFCQYFQMNETKSLPPRCPPPMCANIECSECTNRWWKLSEEACANSSSPSQEDEN